jgi:Na+/citrate or Na+/malate symporter
MRPKKSLFNALLTHFLMGVALGLSMVLLLSLIDAFHVRDLVAKSGAHVQTTLMLVTTYALMFGIGSALTGLVMTLEDES